MSEKKNPFSVGISPKDFMMNVMNGMAIGIIAGLIANAAIGGLLKFLSAYDATGITSLLRSTGVMIQFGTAPAIGFLAGMNFKMPPLKAAMIGLVAFAAAGNIVATPNGYMVKGIGDVLNVLITVSLACYITLKLGNAFGSLTVVLHTIVMGIFVASIGVFLKPYVGAVTTALSETILYFTHLQPHVMAPLIAMTFGFAVASPISSVALGLITGVTGLAGGAANIGVACAAAFLMVAGFKSNRIGVPIAVFFGGIKMLLPNLLLKPVIFIPMIMSCGILGFALSFTDIVVDTATSGFGFIAFAGPINAYELMSAAGTEGSLLQVVGIYGVLNFGVVYGLHFVFSKVLKLYTEEDLRFKADN